MYQKRQTKEQVKKILIKGIRYNIGYQGLFLSINGREIAEKEFSKMYEFVKINVMHRFEPYLISNRIVYRIYCIFIKEIPFYKFESLFKKYSIKIGNYRYFNKDFFAKKVGIEDIDEKIKIIENNFKDIYLQRRRKEKQKI